MPGQRAAQRHLIRWTPEIDQCLLLCVQYVCSDRGVKVPWDAIAKQLDPEAGEGAVIQHLSKLRARLIEQGHGRYVPPPLRRGGRLGVPRSSVANTAASTPSTGRAKRASAGSAAQAAGKNEGNETPEGVEDERAASDDDYEPRPAKKAKRASGHHKPSRQARASFGNDSEFSGEVNESPEPGPSSRRPRNNKGKNPIKKEAGKGKGYDEEESGSSLERAGNAGSGNDEEQDNSSANNESSDSDSDMEDDEDEDAEDDEDDESEEASEAGPIIENDGENVARGTSTGGAVPTGVASSAPLGARETGLISENDGEVVARSTGTGGAVPTGVASSAPLSVRVSMQPQEGFYAIPASNTTFPSHGVTVPGAIGFEHPHFAEHSGAMLNLPNFTAEPGFPFPDTAVETIFPGQGERALVGVAPSERHNVMEQSGPMDHPLASLGQFPFPSMPVNPAPQGQANLGAGGPQEASDAINMDPLSYGPWFGTSRIDNPSEYFGLGPRTPAVISPVPLPFDLRPVSDFMAADELSEMQDPAHTTTEELAHILDEDMLNALESEHGGPSGGLADGNEHVAEH